MLLLYRRTTLLRMLIIGITYLLYGLRPEILRKIRRAEK